MERRYGVGLFVGRFQPTHVGHMYTIAEALKLCDTLFVGIGSATESGTENNPLDAKTRREILEAAIAGEGIDKERIRIILVPDFFDDEKWFRYVRNECQNLSVMFTDNPWCIRICEKERVNVETPLYKRDSVSATNMRELMRKNGDWRSLAPKSAVGIIERHMPKIKAVLEKKRQRLTS